MERYLSVITWPPSNFKFKKYEVRIEEYWKLKKIKIDLKEPEEQFHELLKKSLKLRLRSDVNYGLYYSRNRLITNIFIASKFKYKFYFNDQNWKKDFLKNFQKISYHLDFPVGSLSSYPLWKLAETARKKLK